MILATGQSGISYDVIIPVVSTTLVALIGYVMQIVTLWHTGKKENERKRIEAYTGFYMELIFELSNMVLIYQDYCTRKEKKIAWNEFGKEILVSIAKNTAQGDERNIVDKFNSSIKAVYKIFKEREYYPISKKVHKNCMKLCLYADCINKMNQTHFLNSNIEKCSESILLPDLEKLLKQLAI